MPSNASGRKLKGIALENDWMMQANGSEHPNELAFQIQHDVIRFAFNKMKLPKVEPLDVTSLILSNEPSKAAAILQEKFNEYERAIAELVIDVKARNRFIEDLIAKKDMAALNNAAI
jgi:hypothetical protein